MMSDRLDATFAMDAGSDDEGELAEALDCYLAALESNVPLDVEALAARYPHLADSIRALAGSVELLHAATQDMGRLPCSSSIDKSPRFRSRRLGDFELGREVGRGGMGIVYEARQISLERRVALKVLPFAATWDQKQIARFQNEARAAAQLHHPHIVPVFAVGQERGVHFYAMQFIDGQSLEQLVRQLRNADAGLRATSNSTWSAKSAANADQHAPSAPTTVARTTRRISIAPSGEYAAYGNDLAAYCRAVARLGAQAADALHYAHESGVVHRDVKPSNLLLDPGGKLWIADFGLARVQNSPGVTGTGDVVGTLRYMSPEQAAGKQSLVDACSDVYCLGASLYEMLALRPAFPGDDRQAVLQAIAERDAPPLRQINRAIPADLENIVLRAMAKSRDERYATAADLAADLQRFLDGKATHARRPGFADRVSKRLRRHRRAVALAATLLICLSVGSTWAALLLSREKGRTEAALAQSEQSRRQARQAVDRFGSYFSHQLARLPGSAPLQRELLNETLAYYRQFIAESGNDPALRAELAQTHFQAAVIAGQLGDPASAQASFEEALALFGSLAVAEHKDDANATFQRFQATCLSNLGLLASSQGDVDAARSRYRSAIALLSGDAFPDPPPIEAPYNLDLANAARLKAEVFANQASLERQGGDRIAAGNLLAQSIDLLQRLAEREPDSPELTHALAIALNGRSFVQQPLDWQAAQESCEAAVALLQSLADDATAETEQSLGRRNDLALCLNNLAAIYGHQGSFGDADASYRQAIALQEQLVRQAPSIVQYRGELAVTLNNLGQLLTNEGNLAEADEAFARGRDLLAELVDDYPAELRYRSALAGVLNNQAMAYENRKDWDRAIADYEQAIVHQRTAWELAPEQVELREFLSKHYFNYGRALRSAGRPSDAVQAAQQRRALWPGDVQHLLQVAAEMASAADMMERAAARDAAIASAAATCRQAVDAGWDFRQLADTDAFVNTACLDEIAALIEGGK